MFLVLSMLIRSFQRPVIKVSTVKPDCTDEISPSEPSPELTEADFQDGNVTHRNKKKEKDESPTTKALISEFEYDKPSRLHRAAANFEVLFATGDGGTKLEFKYGMVGAILLCIVLLFFAGVMAFRTIMPLLSEFNYQ
ncbi:hypothetical protein CDIK_1668 [Cucumispora dikerogammari]|nr:hypothetical protein CDIK_1668 [Cucumispora dikerogammari]